MRLKKQVSILLYLMILGVISLQSCVKGIDLEGDELAQIKDYLRSNNITIQPTESGLYYIEHTAGPGASPEVGDSVSINFVGKKLNGYVFDTNLEEVAKQYNLWDIYVEYKPFTFMVGDSNLIVGLSEGLSYMNEGAFASILLPSKLAFNDYSPVIFEIELLKVQKAGE